MDIRRATPEDIPGINRLLRQVLTVHHLGRPDIFKSDAKKYTDDELTAILENPLSPVFVACDGQVLGYAFCQLRRHENHNILTDIKTLYIDDLCVEEALRGNHIGRALYDHVVSFAQSAGCYNITLNVWACNPNAAKFYQSCGLVPQKTEMETIL